VRIFPVGIFLPGHSNRVLLYILSDDIQRLAFGAMTLHRKPVSLPKRVQRRTFVRTNNLLSLLKARHQAQGCNSRSSMSAIDMSPKKHNPWLSFRLALGRPNFVASSPHFSLFFISNREHDPRKMVLWHHPQEVALVFFCIHTSKKLVGGANYSGIMPGRYILCAMLHCPVVKEAELYFAVAERVWVGCATLGNSRSEYSNTLSL
jgi:hypothetical protein